MSYETEQIWIDFHAMSSYDQQKEVFTKEVEALINKARIEELEKVNEEADGWELQTEDRLEPYVKNRLKRLKSEKGE